MARKMSAKRRFEAVWEAVWELDKNPETQPPAPTKEKDSSEAAKWLARGFRRPLLTAFKKARLDIRNDAHRLWVLLVLASVVFGLKGPGQPKKWSNKKLGQLVKDIAKVKTKYPHDMELKCCERLIKDSPHCHYNNVGNAKTLRRVLQTAKQLQKDAQLVAAVRNGAAATDLTNVLKKRP